MITEDYVSFETAKLLKEKGFDCISFYCYEEKGINGILFVTLSAPLSNSDLDNTIEPHKCYSAPTLQMAMKWLREMYNLHILSVPYPHEDGVFYWAYKIAFLDSDTLAVMVTKKAAVFDTYEQACEAAIKYCLTNLI